MGENQIYISSYKSQYHTTPTPSLKSLKVSWGKKKSYQNENGAWVLSPWFLTLVGHENYLRNNNGINLKITKWGFLWSPQILMCNQIRGPCSRLTSSERNGVFHQSRVPRVHWVGEGPTLRTDRLFSNFAVHQNHLKSFAKPNVHATSHPWSPKLWWSGVSFFFLNVQLGWRTMAVDQGFSQLTEHQWPRRHVSSQDTALSSSQVPDSVGLGEGWEHEFLTHSKNVTPMLLAWPWRTMF